MSARTRSIEVKVGALIISSIIILIAFLLVLGDIRLKDQASLFVDFANSGDLKTGAPVKITGVTVGKVTEVSLWGGRRDVHHGNKVVHVRICIRLDADALQLLHDDATFTISTLGVLGEKYIEIDPGSPERPTLQDGQVVDGTSPMKMEAILGQVTRIADNVDRVVRENREDIREIVKRLKSSLEHVDILLSENGPAVREAIGNVARISHAIEVAIGSGDDIRTILASTRSLAERLNREAGTALPQAIERFSNAADEVKLLMNEGRGLIHDIKGLASDARTEVLSALSNVKSLTEKAKDPKGSIGALLSDRELYDDIVALIKDIKRHPWKILWKE